MESRKYKNLTFTIHQALLYNYWWVRQEILFSLLCQCSEPFADGIVPQPKEGVIDILITHCAHKFLEIFQQISNVEKRAPILKSLCLVSILAVGELKERHFYHKHSLEIFKYNKEKLLSASSNAKAMTQKHHMSNSGTPVPEIFTKVAKKRPVHHQLWK